VTPDGLIATASVRLAAAGVESARAEARRLLAHTLGEGRERTLSSMPVTPAQQAAFEDMTERRIRREPLAYLTGRREFWSLDLEVGPGVLIPRPETETLIEQALRLFPDRAAPLVIADLGTGSGAILLAALQEFPNARGIGFEASARAFAWAERNAATHAPGRARILQTDWDQAPSDAYDLVFSNPPYIPTADIRGLEPEVRDHEPRAALDGGPDGLAAYRSLAVLLPRILRPGGWAVLELGAGQDAAMGTLFPGQEIGAIAPDLAGIPRALVLKKPK
jgi:release factor glutamine methyltransferase